MLLSTLPLPVFFDHPGNLALARALVDGHVDVEPFGIDTATGVDGKLYWGGGPGYPALLAGVLTATRSEAVAIRATPALAALLLMLALIWFARVPAVLASLLVLAPPLSFYAVGLSGTLLSAAAMLVAARARSEGVAGLAAGLIPLIDVRVAPMTLVACTSLRTLCWALPGWLVLGWWNTRCFGAPWAWGVTHVGAFPWEDSVAALFGWWSPWQGLGMALLGTEVDDVIRNQIGEMRYGLLLVAPWIVLAPLGWLVNVRTRRHVLALGLSIVTALVLATFRATQARYFVPFVPLWIAPLFLP